MIPLFEAEKVFYVNKDKELLKQTIIYALLEAYRTRAYVKFYVGRYYISVTFNRDYTVQISTNYHEDRYFSREIRKLETRPYRVNDMAYFLHYWLNKFRHLKF